MAIREFEQFQDMVSRLYPELHNNAEGTRDVNRVLTKSVTFQVTDACNLACSYCYQINKGKRRMSLEVAKRAIDQLLSGENGIAEYCSPENSPGIILDFIGGEPFLEIELIEQICDYFRQQVVLRDHPWRKLWVVSICSNGVLYFDPKVQHFLEKYGDRLSFSVTIDGNKELHDACRRFPDGKPSYDLAVAAAKDWMSRGGTMGSKITIAPGNVQFVADAIKHMVSLGYHEINANCVYEEGWKLEHAQELYRQMKVLADYLLENNLTEDIYCSLFKEDFFRPKPETDLDNWCGGNGVMLAVDPDGTWYPCLRYMESSLGTDQPAYSIGNVWEGIGQTECGKSRIECLHCIDRRTQSTDECFYCPIAEGCSWCTAYNYQVFGTPDARATFICVMHKARALANVYYWNKYYRKFNLNKRLKMHCPPEWGVPIVGEEEYTNLCLLAVSDWR